MLSALQLMVSAISSRPTGARFGRGGVDCRLTGPPLNLSVGAFAVAVGEGGGEALGEVRHGARRSW